MPHMEVKHIRKLLPVGHGAFFVERLVADGDRMLTAVYDCGDSNAGALIKMYAQKEFGKPEEPVEHIDLLFISHFDTDHVNGLEYLKPYLKPSTRVFLPFYYANFQSIYDNNKRTGIDYVVNTLGQVQLQPTLVQYREGSEPRQPIDVDEERSEYRGGVISSGQPIVKKYNGQPIWKYVPFNLFNEEKLYTDFIQRVKSVLHWDDLKLQDAANWSDQDVKSLRRIYKTFSRHTINDNSLIVLSDRYCKVYDDYAENISCNLLHHYSDCPCSHWCCSRYRASCLYTGDTVMKRGVRRSNYSDRYEDFVKELRLHTNFISLMQIPHHGSSNNSNVSALCDCMSHRLFSNYAVSDTSTSTFFLTTNTLDTVWKNVYRVTEDDKTLFEEFYMFLI